VRWFLLWALSTVGVFIVAFCIAFLMARGRLRRRHRVDHRVPTQAPLAWLVDPRLPAKLHRRLSRVGSTAIAVADDHRPKRRLGRPVAEDAIAQIAEEVRVRSIELDAHLTRLALLAPVARRDALFAVSEQVATLEATAARLATMSVETSNPRVLTIDDPDLADLKGRLDRLVEAHRELDEIDSTAGLIPARR